MEQLPFIQQILLIFIQALFAAALPLLLWKLNAYAKAKVHDSRFHCAMDKLTTAAETSIMTVFQTYSKEVKKNGKWGGEAAGIAKQIGMEHMKALLGKQGLAEAKGCLKKDETELNHLMDSMLESVLVRLKASGVLPEPAQPEAGPPPAAAA